jgi:hypothetical protein
MAGADRRPRRQHHRGGGRSRRHGGGHQPLRAGAVSTASTLHRAGQTEIETAAQAAEALRPIAGDAAGILFALGIIGVGFLGRADHDPPAPPTTSAR